MTAFVPAHRCGAVPEFHRVPSWRLQLTSAGVPTQRGENYARANKMSRNLVGIQVCGLSCVRKNVDDFVAARAPNFNRVRQTSTTERQLIDFNMHWNLVRDQEVRMSLERWGPIRV